MVSFLYKRRYIFIAGLAISNLALAAAKSWKGVDQLAQNTVVQIWSQKARFNWIEPYKSPEQEEAAGTGFFISQDGYMLTNYHVVSSAKSVFINVPFIGRKLLDANIVGVCPDFDVALLKLSDYSTKVINAYNEANSIKKLPYLSLGNSDKLYPTEHVLALGYPMGFRYLKSTLGDIAGREFLGGKCYMHITAPINPGNSGGPLLNINGEVVGINSAGFPNAQNVGYIHPINDIKSVLGDLYKGKNVRRPSLGFGFNPATDEHTALLKNPVPGGIYVNSVEKLSLADRVGIKSGDMIYEIYCNGSWHKIDEFGDVTVTWRGSTKISVAELLMRCSIGETIKIILYRNGKKVEVSGIFELTDRHNFREIFPEFEPEEVDYEMIGGAVFMQLRKNHIEIFQHSPFLKKYAKLDAKNKNAVIITRVLPGSQMHVVECVFAGTLVKSVNGKDVTTLKELREALMLSLKTGHIALSLKDYNISTVLSLNKVLNDEIRLSRDFVFPVTETVKKMMKAVLEKQAKSRPKK